MDKETMIKDIMEKIESMSVEQQIEVAELIQRALEEMRKNK